MKSKYGVDVEQQAQQHDDVSHRRNRPDHGADDQTEFGEYRDYPSDAQQTRQAGDHRECADLGQHGSGYHREVEDIPAVREERSRSRPVREDANGYLGNEDRLDQHLERHDRCAVSRSDRGRRLDTNDDCAYNDDTEDEVLKARVARDAAS